MPAYPNMTSHQPISPVGVIAPWTTPFMLSTWKIAPAPAAGCLVVHKPAELGPLSARLLIQNTIADGFCARPAARVGAIRVGPPLDPATEGGPLIHETHVDKVMSGIARGQAEGARLAAVGRDGGDWWFDFGLLHMPTKSIAPVSGQHPIPRLGA